MGILISAEVNQGATTTSKIATIQFFGVIRTAVAAYDSN
jgi:hypothetical protein